MNDDLKNILKHNKKTSINMNLIKDFLWYSFNKYCPMQSSREYENSWVNTEEVNVYFAIAIKHYLKLEAIKCLNAYVEADDEIDKFKNVLYITKNASETLFESFFNKLRNSIAHGTFNNVRDTFYFVGQLKAKIESPINFYLKLSKTSVRRIHNCVNKVLRILEEGSLYKILKLMIKLSKRNDFYFYDDKNNIKTKIIFNESHSKISKKDVESLLRKYANESDSVIVICRSINKQILSKNLKSEDGKIRIIDYRFIIETFNLEGISLE